jgi:hypothetical protein
MHEEIAWRASDRRACLLIQQGQKRLDFLHLVRLQRTRLKSSNVKDNAQIVLLDACKRVRLFTISILREGLRPV